MTFLVLVLVLGLTLFLGIHSMRIEAQDCRQRRFEAMGLNGWKGMYLLLALALGQVAWAGSAFWGHAALFGVRPFDI